MKIKTLNSAWWKLKIFIKLLLIYTIFTGNNFQNNNAIILKSAHVISRYKNLWPIYISSVVVVMQSSAGV